MMSEAESTRGGFTWLWLMSFALIAGSNSRWLIDDSLVMTPAMNCLLTPADAWQVPFARTWIAERVGQWPSLLFVAIAAVAVTLICRCFSRSLTAETALLAVGLSLLVRPMDLPALGLMLLIAAVCTSRLPQIIAGLLVDVICLLAVLFVLDFGIILILGLVAQLMLLSDPARHSGRRSQLWPAGLWSAGVLAALLVPGFRAALFRPISWVWIDPPVRLMPTMSAAAGVKALFVPLGLTVLFSILAWRRLLVAPSSPARWLVLPYVTFCAIGFGCAYYLPLCAVAMAVLLAPYVRWTPQRYVRPVIVLLVAVSCARLWWHTDWAPLLTGETLPRRVDPLAWGSRGPVILLNLDQSSKWQSGVTGRRFPLVLNGRWDVFGDQYNEYAAVGRDLRDVRMKSYLRDDGRWGGYQRRIAEWAPALLVVDSTDLFAIRGLSLSPDWQVMGIDGYRTIFGHTDVRQNSEQIQNAGQCLIAMEWSVNLAEAPLDRTFATATAKDRRRVAAVLRAIRLPYAALRFIESDDGSDIDLVRMWCYLELAHRTARHSGRPSLMDQYRAIALLRRNFPEVASLPAERLRLQQSLAGLGISAELTSTGSVSLKLSNQTSSDARAESVGESTEQDAESVLRGALALGSERECRRLLANVDGAVATYYSILVDAPLRNAQQTTADLQRLVEAGGLPERLRQEALFYLGCSAVESGNPSLAVSAFVACREMQGTFPMHAILDFYLAELLRG